MATPFSTIVDRALITVSDYKLDRLYEEDMDAFEEILVGYIIKAIPNFTQCLKPLTYNLEAQEFNADLDMYEINILADYVVITWYEAQLQDVLEFQESLQDKEFKRYSTGQNLKPRQEYLERLYTKVKQDGQNYQSLMNFNSLPFFGGDA